LNPFAIFFGRRFLLLHLLHFSAEGGFRAPHFLHTFLFNTLL